MGSLNAGDLNRRADLSHRTLARDAQGQEVESFTTYASGVPVKTPEKYRGYEIFAQSQVTREARYRIVLRYRADLLDTDRLVIDGVTYDVDYISEIGLHEGLELLVKLVR